MPADPQALFAVRYFQGGHPIEGMLLLAEVQEVLARGIDGALQVWVAAYDGVNVVGRWVDIRALSIV